MNNETDEKVGISLIEWYKHIALEVELRDNQSFLMLAETLERIGVLSTKDMKIYQSCHIFYKKEKYYIVHFKELFALDGRPVNLTQDDIGRRNTIATLLEEWNFIKIVNKQQAESLKVPVSSIKVIKASARDEYELVPKYQIGAKHNR